MGVLMFLCCNLKSATKRALTVFIGNYPAESGWRTISSLNDKILIMDMLHANAFSDKDIICLEDAHATYASIMKSFDALAASVCKGDVVYIHFSCHGQQITDQDGDEAFLRRNEKYDSAIIPYDALPEYGMNGYHGNLHLIDDTLNEQLNRIAVKLGKNGVLLVVLDACHSGDGTRYIEEDESYPYRGIFDRFEQPLRYGPRAKQANQVNWVSISACTSIQNNYEVSIDGSCYGRLSYAVSRCLRQGATVPGLIDDIMELYEQLPVPKGRRQTLSFEVPASYKTRIIF